MRTAVALLLFLGVAQAGERSIHFERLDVDLEIRRDGSVAVEETFRIRYVGPWKGLVRTIPLQGPEGEVGFELDGVTDAQGKRLIASYETTLDDGLLIRVVVPSAKDATKQVTLRYTMEGVVQKTSDGRGRVDWNVAGLGWDEPLEQIHVRIRTPWKKTQVSGATGPPGSTATDFERVRTRDGVPTLRTTKPLPPGSAFTVTVEDAAHVARPAGAPSMSLGVMTMLLLPLLPLLL